jgi:hypothetical protein
MTSRWLAMIMVFLSLAAIQTSFIASLPGWLAFTPLVVAAGVYMVQYEGQAAGAVWIMVFGLFLEIMSIPSFPWETFSYLVGAAICYFSARHVFSNRSWYGLAACGVAVVLGMHLVRAAVLAVVSLRQPEGAPWNAFADSLVWNALLMVGLLTVLFIFGRPLRHALRRAFLVSRERDTL